MKWMAFVALLLACNGRVEPAAADAASTDAVPGDAGLCTNVVAMDCTDSATFRPFRRVDMTRRCVDIKSDDTFETCTCIRSSVACWVEQATGTVLTSPCSQNLLPGYCRCDEALYREATNFPRCP